MSMSASKLRDAIADPQGAPVDIDELKASLGLNGPPSRDDALSVIENEFLKPVRGVERDKLWRWQVQPKVDLPAPQPTLAPLPPTHNVTPTLKGLDGNFTHWRETLAPKPPPLPSLSSSTSRAPAPSANFVRGKGSYAPFLPGGLDLDTVTADGEFAQQAPEEDEEEEEGWKTRAPGFKRGVQLEGADDFLASILGSDTLSSKAKRKKHAGQPKSPTLQISRLGDADVDYDSERPIGEKAKAKNVDDLLPLGRLPAPPAALKRPKPTVAKKEWAHVVDVKKELLNFDELVPDMARKYPFTLDNFQKEAVYRLEMGDSVFVAAHTSAGKTVVAEYAIALAAKHMTRAIYTSPIKALSNQKFRDFKTTFDPSTVGILTGDVQINPEGNCLIMTTEILRSMLYKGADLIRDVEFVIFDEVHYVNDAERGVVWEEVIIMLPDHVNIILLSATVPNTREFADWVGRTKKKDIYVISTPMRPVPLEHFLWAGKEVHKIVDSKGQFLGAGYQSAGDAMRRKQDKEREAAGLPPLTKTGGRGQPARGGAKSLPTGRGAPFTRVGAGRTHTNRAGGNGAPPPAVAPRGGGGGGRGGFGAPRGFGGAGNLDQTLWVSLVDHLRKASLLPMVAFVFSKKRCEEYAKSLLNRDLCTAKEKSEVHITIERALTRLKGSDKNLPQIARMRELLGNGIGVHHGGLLPIVKEVVEMLFARGLVKVLFATETFAMGVNMPAKSVVFSGIRKHDGNSFRTLLPGEYTQMAGRAGRRGLDTTGTVIILPGDELPEAGVLKEMMQGTPSKLSSQFRLTYNMILNLLRVEALRVEEMIKRSFSENASQKLLPEQQKQVEATEKMLAKLPKVDCPVCSPVIRAYYDVSQEVTRLNTSLLREAALNPQQTKCLAPGRLVVLRDGHFPGNVAVVLRPSPATAAFSSKTAHRGDGKTYWVLALVSAATKDRDEDIDIDDLTPMWPAKLARSEDDWTYELASIDISSISVVTKSFLKFPQSSFTELIEGKAPEARAKMAEDLRPLADEMVKTGAIEMDWGRMRGLEFQDLVRQRDTMHQRVTKMACALCEDFDEHYSALHEIKRVEASLAHLKLMLSDQNLELLPDYEQRVEVLKRLKFIDDNSTVLLKGRVACEINSSNELVLTELILENTLASYSPEEVVALLSVFVFVEKTDSEPVITPSVQTGLEIIYQIADRVERVQDSLSVAHDDFRTKFKPGLVEVVYEWARGMPFDKITDLTDVPEGTIVRCITRLDETCREVRDAARVIGDADLFTKMEEAQALIKRDIVFAASLYF